MGKGKYIKDMIKIKKEYSIWFDQLIHNYCNDHRPDHVSIPIYRSMNGLFVTVSFEPDFTKRLSNAESVFDNFHGFYLRCCRQLLGRNFNRDYMRNQQPLAIAALDVNGTRYWQSMGELENPHIHSIWIFPAGMIGRFRELLADELWIEKTRCTLHIREIDVQPLRLDDQRDDSPSKVSSYTAKFIDHNNQNLDAAEDLRIYPLVA